MRAAHPQVDGFELIPPGSTRPQVDDPRGAGCKAMGQNKRHARNREEFVAGELLVVLRAGSTAVQVRSCVFDPWGYSRAGELPLAPQLHCSFILKSSLYRRELSYALLSATRLRASTSTSTTWSWRNRTSEPPGAEPRRRERRHRHTDGIHDLHVRAALAQMELEIKRERVNDSNTKRRDAGLDLGGRRPVFSDS